MRRVLAAAIFVVLLAGCGNKAPEAPPRRAPSATTTPTASSATSSAAVTVPVMPEVARSHTEAGAKAFVVYYWHVVDYVQQTLNTAPIEVISATTCAGCQAGIEAMRKLARRHSHLTGGAETVSSLRSEAVIPNHSVLVAFNLTNEPQRVDTPGKKTVLHPGGTTNKLMSLLPREDGWIAGELRSQP
ncbi:DUF6318 family protein [Nocardioides sp. BP30]|uniref:DUF6318 family protein n=1 Tax=Nocardioides sp. BP30 TaxID=3036374 RepID=UPI002469A4EF|nr:DUF6318 family protein [Nocardioides sp. BP30]WGL53885.1 DUF6318 family protein [Nocardioides sp. BP30]